MGMTAGELFGMWVAAGLTLMMFSFIYKDNVFFKIGEHLYLGLSVGYFVNVQYWNTLYPEVIRRVSIEHQYWVVIPALLGVFLLLRLVPSLAWLSRTAFAFYIGGSVGLSVPNVLHGSLLPQLFATMAPFSFTPQASAGINQLVLIVGVFCVLIFFFFSLEHKKLVGGISRVGLIYLMLGFGAAFGTTVMARVSLLIGRFQFLINDFIKGVVLGQR